MRRRASRSVAIEDRVRRGHLDGPDLPFVREGDLQSIASPLDFLGVNYYTRQYARHVWYLPFFRTWVDRDPPPGIAHPVLGPHAYPEGIGELLKRYREEYGDPAVKIERDSVEKQADGRVLIGDERAH